jgi:enoyl-CoA hydratase
VAFPTSALEIMRLVLGRRTRDLVLSARSLDRDEALAVGLVDELVDPEDLLPRARAVAADLAALPAGVFAHTKRQLQAPARDAIALRAATDDAAIHTLWQSAPVRTAIGDYLARLASGRASRG